MILSRLYKNQLPGKHTGAQSATRDAKATDTAAWDITADKAAAGSWADRPAAPFQSFKQLPARPEGGVTHSLESVAEVRSANQSTHHLEPEVPAAVTEEAGTATTDTQVSPDFDAIGRQLQAAMGDRFAVVRPLSVGGMATIFQLRSRAHGGLLALKLLHPHLLAQPGIREAFQREARSLARLSGHPNSVAVIDLLEVDGTPAILMPFVAGEDLDQLLQRTGPLDREQTMMLAAQVASLLMYAESLGLTHGDLAPGNIRLDVFGQYRLLDFGLSRSADSTPEEHAPLAGTPAYNSPEQLRGEVPDIRSDLYALGAILVEARTGHPLFQAASLPELAAKHLHADWALPPEVEEDRPLAALVRGLLATDLADRMSSSFELTGALAAFGYELPSFAQSLTPDLVEAPRPRRKRLQEG